MIDITGVRGTVGRLGNSSLGKYISRGVGETFGQVYEKGINKGFLGRMSSSKLAKAFGVFNLTATLGSIYQGGQTGGFEGAAKESFNQSAYGVAGNMLIRGIFNPVTLVGATTLAVGYSGFKFGQAATQHRKHLRRTEMISKNSANIINGASTDRARSLQALNNSSMNGRMSLGNEAQLLHTSYSGMSTFRR